MTRVLRVPAAGDRSLLAIAQGRAPSAQRSRAAAEAKRAGQSFEDVVELAIAGDAAICLARGHAATKVVPDGRGGRKLIYAKKNGVDFVGTVRGIPLALEAKRLPGVASLSGTKNDSTRAEALFLARFAAARGVAGFLCYDPEREALAWVRAAHCPVIAAGGRVPLRTPQGIPLVPTWRHPNGRPMDPELLRHALFAVVREQTVSYATGEQRLGVAPLELP